jgi:hypothetical protein
MAYEEFVHERPLFGYELSPPNPQWPNDAKVAVTFVIEYTEGGESSVEYGEESSEGELGFQRSRTIHVPLIRRVPQPCSMS